MTQRTDLRAVDHQSRAIDMPINSQPVSIMLISVHVFSYYLCQTKILKNVYIFPVQH